jgi:predicted NBD/HSP70 family sugar kinase
MVIKQSFLKNQNSTLPQKRLRSADKYLIRRLNMSLMLSSLRVATAQTRAALAVQSGLSRATISSLIDELIELGLVREIGLQRSEGGRPGTALELNPAGGAAIGIEIGVDFVSVVLTDFVAQIRWRKQVTFKIRDVDEAIQIAERLADEAQVYRSQLGLRLLGVGVGLPGLVKVPDGMLTFAPNLGWQNIPFQAMWAERFGVPTHVINEGSAAAFGEHYYGVAAGYDDFIYLSASTVGIGAGIMIGGRLYQGIDGYAGEIGHMVLDPSGPLCACGRHGCWEKVAGAPAVIKYVVDQASHGRTSMALDAVDGNAERLTTDLIAYAAHQHDSVAYEALERVSHLFGIGVINLMNTFNPELIVIGGALSRALKPFLPVIETVVNQQAFRALADKVSIRISSLGDDACVMGAIAAVFDEVVTDPVQHLEVMETSLAAIQPMN